jgi:DNA-binding NarL/FixJ family response regulator
VKTAIKNIIIIEDNPDIRNGFQLLINSTGKFTVSHTFESCELAFEKIKTIKPDLVLMDIDLPGMNGIEGTRYIKSILPQTEILIITIFENSSRVFEGLCAGASGYLTKNSNHIQLLSAIEELSLGGAPMSANIARMVAQSFVIKNNNLLSDREMDVLKLLVEGKSYKTIADTLDISLSTVKFHIKNIYIKLQVTSKEDAITKAKINKLV